MMRRPDADRLVVVMSDIEMGAGGRFDDFPHSDYLAALIDEYSDTSPERLPVSLVFNGDTFDLLKTSYRDSFPHHVSSAVALAKLRRVAAAHRPFFDALARFLSRSPERRIYFTVGNHDPELMFPEVQALLRELCGGAAQLVFPGLELVIGRVWIAHGAQFDPLFAMDPERPFVRWEGEPVLNLPWGAVALLDTVMPLQPLLHFHDRLKPRNQVFGLLPEIKELLLGRFWRYWTREYWQGYFDGHDPMKRFTWTMARELAWRWSSKDAEVSIGDEVDRRLVSSDERRLYIVGHQHQPRWLSYGDRRVIQTGCIRNEYMIEEGGKGLRPIPKSYAEVLMRDGVPVGVRLMELPGPEAPEGYIPNSIFDVRAEVRALLGASSERHAVRAAQEEQQAREAKQRDRALPTGPKTS